MKVSWDAPGSFVKVLFADHYKYIISSEIEKYIKYWSVLKAQLCLTARNTFVFEKFSVDKWKYGNSFCSFQIEKFKETNILLVPMLFVWHYENWI